MYSLGPSLSVSLGKKCTDGSAADHGCISRHFNNNTGASFSDDGSLGFLSHHQQQQQLAAAMQDKASAHFPTLSGSIAPLAATSSVAVGPAPIISAKTTAHNAAGAAGAAQLLVHQHGMVQPSISFRTAARGGAAAAGYFPSLAESFPAAAAATGRTTAVSSKSGCGAPATVLAAGDHDDSCGSSTPPAHVLDLDAFLQQGGGIGRRAGKGKGRGARGRDP